MQKLDGEIEEVNGWIHGAEKKMDDIDNQGPNDTVLKVFFFLLFIFDSWSIFLFLLKIEIILPLVFLLLRQIGQREM